MCGTCGIEARNTVMITKWSLVLVNVEFLSWRKENMIMESVFSYLMKKE